jgi:hypothetical protein
MKWMYTFIPACLISASIAHGGSLRGIVRDAQSLVPLDGVSVIVHVIIPDSIPFPTTTDANGRYSIAGIIPGNKIYEVVARKSGYIMSVAKIDSLGSLDLVYDIDLTQEPIIQPGEGVDSSTVFGKIMTPSPSNESLNPISTAQVRLASGSQEFVALTNAEGQYTMKIPLGMYSILVSADGYHNLTLTGIQVQSVGATVNAVLQSTETGISPNQEPIQVVGFTLSDAYPNPFNPSTTILFSVPQTSGVTLKIFNAMGQEVTRLVSQKMIAGIYSSEWNASGFPSGVYYCRLEAGGLIETKKLVLLR